MLSQTSTERYARAKEIFFAALELDTAEHAEFIQISCGGDVELRLEVESLLAMRDDARDFLESPAFETNFTHENLENKIIGGYRLIREIGAGGMGVVFLAEKTDAGFHRQAALKIVKNNLHSKAVFRRFNLERRILAALEHPNIAHLIDGGTTDDNLPYLVMEYVEGVPLIEYAETKNLSLTTRLELFRQVCAAVAFAHQHSVIHRDLKPSNILVTADGSAKLLDFGVAKLLSPDTAPSPDTATTFRAMTPEYASPEQIKGKTVTTVSDVYSLGVILYQLLTGAHPYKFDSENINEIIRAICEDEPERPSSVVIPNSKLQIPNSKFRETNPQSQIPNPKSLRGDLDNIILKALRKEPTRRYASVEAFSADLRRHLDGLPVTARRDTFFYRTEKFVRRNRLAVALAALIIFVLLGGISATIWQSRRAEQERARAERRFNDIRSLANSFVFELNEEILKGQTQGRELVVRRALEYLDRLAAEAEDDASLQRELAVAYLKIGDIQGKPYSPNLGNTEGAFESYGKALTILETLHQADFANFEIGRDLSAAYLNIGSLQHLRMLKSDEAIENLQKSRALCESLIAADATNAEYRRMMADVYKSLGDALSDRDERIAAHRKALALREELLAADPTNTNDRVAVASIHQRLGTLLENIANVTKNADDYRAALKNFDKALAIYQELQTAEPNNSRHRRNVADMTAARIPLLASSGDKAGAINGYKTALEIFGELAAADPKNAEAQLDVALTHQLMCRTLGKLNDTAGAVKSCRQGLQVGESMLTNDPTNAEVIKYLLMNHGYIAEALKNADDVGGAIKSRQQAVEIAEQWSAAEPQNAGISYIVADIRNEIGKLYGAIASNPKISFRKKNEHRQSACHWFRRSLDVWRDLQKRNAVTESYISVINEAEQEVVRCNPALQ